MAGCSRVGPSHFFKVILPSTLQDKKLRIPEKFVRKFGDELSDVATLTVPSGQEWQVGLLKERRMIWLHNGWHDFVQCHSISAGYFLVFKFEKNSSFHVIIFDMSACEINYPSFNGGEEPKNCLKTNQMANEESVEVLGSTTPPSQQYHKPALGSAMESNRIQNCTTSLESSRYKHGYRQQSKKCKTKELMEINESPRGLLKMTTEPKEVVATENGDEVNKRTKSDAYEFFALLEEMRISISESCIYFSREERRSAICAARLFKPKNPSFLVMLRANYIHKQYVYVPANFFSKCFSKDINAIKIQDSNGNEWPAKIRWPNGGCLIVGGRAGFMKNLREGDICLFELIRREDLLLKVSVFHAFIEKEI